MQETGSHNEEDHHLHEDQWHPNGVTEGQPDPPVKKPGGGAEEQQGGETSVRVFMERDGLRQEVRKLRGLLHKEREWHADDETRISQLQKELHDTRMHLAEQKDLKNIFIKKEKEARRELELLRKYADTETLGNTKIASQVQNEVKHKKKKLLQKDYEELKVAHVLGQEKFSAELQEERSQNALLRQEVDAIQASHQEVSRRCENVRLEADALKQRLEVEIESHADKVKDDLQVMESLRAEQEVVRRNMEEQMDLLKRDAGVSEEGLRRELEELKLQLSAESCRNLELQAQIRVELEDRRSPGKLDEERERDDLSVTLTPDPQEEASVGSHKSVSSTKMPSWKTARRFIEMRTLKKWKKTGQQS